MFKEDIFLVRDCALQRWELNIRDFQVTLTDDELVKLAALFSFKSPAVNFTTVTHSTVPTTDMYLLFCDKKDFENEHT